MREYNYRVRNYPPNHALFFSLMYCEHHPCNGSWARVLFTEMPVANCHTLAGYTPKQSGVII